MPRSRVLQGILNNTLASYLSRYSDFDGYWVFGFIVPTLTELRIDLLELAAHDDPATQECCDRAVVVFHRQLALSRYAIERLASAVLVLTKETKPTELELNSSPSTGWWVTATAFATTRAGRRFQAELRVAVAPHNPLTERRSGRADVG